MMTENMKIWLKELYLSAVKDHLIEASNEHIWAYGAPDDETAMLHEMNSDEHKEFANLLKSMAAKIEEEN